MIFVQAICRCYHFSIYLVRYNIHTLVVNITGIMWCYSDQGTIFLTPIIVTTMSNLKVPLRCRQPNDQHSPKEHKQTNYKVR